MTSRDVQFIEEEAWDGSIEKTENVRSCLSHDDDEEEIAERHPSLPMPPPQTQGQQGNPQACMRTHLRSDDSASPSISQGETLSASLFELYFHVEDPIRFSRNLQDKFRRPRCSALKY